MKTDNLLTQGEYKILLPKPEKIKDRIFYTLPKIHKPVSSWSQNNKIPPGRPIIGNGNSEDTEISKYIDTFLQPLVAKQPFILSNTDHLLHTISSHKITTNSLLFTLDVASLYTNIPITEGLETIKNFFTIFPNPNRPDKEILKLLSISLLRNDFFFNGEFFRQIKGVAMGKQYAPNFANLYMSQWENEILNTLPGPKPSLWLRYIDDIFGIWEGSLGDLLNFVDLANKFNANIQITCNSSLTDVQFLDLVIFKSQSKLSTMVYLKPTSSLRLIHPKSLHPRHTKSGVIFSQILRFYKNCTTQKDFFFHLNFLFGSLRDQGYSRSTLREAKSKVFRHVNFSIDLEGVFLKGFFPCQNNCRLCQFYGICKSFITFEGGARQITQFLTCGSKNVIYVICCSNCHKQYVGETSNSVKLRLTQHLSDIRRQNDTPVSQHFNSPHHKIEDLKFFALAMNSNWDEVKRTGCPK
jgi:hypothetical protein